jgi:hypothetical protein
MNNSFFADLIDKINLFFQVQLREHYSKEIREIETEWEDLKAELDKLSQFIQHL